MTDTFCLQTERLILRRPDLRDFPALEAFYASDRSHYTGGPKDRIESWTALAAMIGNWTLRGFGLLTMTDRETGETLGLTGMHYPIHWPEREIGWHIWKPEAEGKGYAFEGASAALRHVFTKLGWETAVSYVAHGNDRSVALAKRLGGVEDASAATPRSEPCHVFRHAKDRWLA
jgi:RimJ/RimL family protein N-acetyltransferase